MELEASHREVLDRVRDGEISEEITSVFERTAATIIENMRQS